MASDRAPMAIADLEAYLRREFAQMFRDFRIDAGPPLRLCLPADERHLRPGNTISGPAMFGLVDVSFYVTLLAEIGPQALAVTTNVSIDFMRKPPGDRDLYAETRLLKVGRALAVGDVLVFSEGLEKPVARAGVTYSIPPSQGA